MHPILLHWLVLWSINLNYSVEHLPGPSTAECFIGYTSIPCLWPSSVLSGVFGDRHASTLVTSKHAPFIWLFLYVQYNPCFKPGFGLTDGEEMKRLWACLRRYGRMTKEMRPSHRTDVLTDVFLYVGSKAAARLWRGPVCMHDCKYLQSSLYYS